MGPISVRANNSIYFGIFRGERTTTKPIYFYVRSFIGVKYPQLPVYEAIYKDFMGALL